LVTFCGGEIKERRGLSGARGSVMGVGFVGIINAYHPQLMMRVVFGSGNGWRNVQIMLGIARQIAAVALSIVPGTVWMCGSFAA